MGRKEKKNYKNMLKVGKYKEQNCYKDRYMSNTCPPWIKLDSFIASASFHLIYTLLEYIIM